MSCAAEGVYQLTRGRYAPTPPPPFLGSGAQGTISPYPYAWNAPRAAISVDRTPKHDPQEFAAEYEFWQRVKSTFQPYPLFVRRRMIARVERSHEKQGRHVAALALRKISPAAN